MFLCFVLPEAPRVESVKGAVHRFSFRNVEIGGVLVIEVLREVGFATPDTRLDRKGSGFKRKLRTEKFNRTSPFFEIEFDVVRFSREMRVKVVEYRIKADLDHDVFERLVREVFDFSAHLVASGEHRRLLTR
jgi:hypothetical protein